MSFTLGDTTHILDAGSCVVAFPYVHHRLDTTISEDTPITVIISFHDDFLTSRGYDFFSHDSEFTRFEGKKIPALKIFDQNKKQDADKLIRKIIAEFSNHFDMSFKQLSEYLVDFLHILCSEPFTIDEKKFELIKTHTEAINDSIKYMALHYGDKISTSDLCRIAAMSQCSYIRKFKALTKLSPMSFLTKVRASEARLLLITTNMSIGQIAQRVGFYDKSRLIHVFNEIYGTSPMSFKNALSKSFFELSAETSMSWEWLTNKNEL